MPPFKKLQKSNRKVKKKKTEKEIFQFIFNKVLRLKFKYISSLYDYALFIQKEMNPFSSTGTVCSMTVA